MMYRVDFMIIVGLLLFAGFVVGSYFEMLQV